MDVAIRPPLKVSFAPGPIYEPDKQVFVTNFIGLVVAPYRGLCAEEAGDKCFRGPCQGWRVCHLERIRLHSKSIRAVPPSQAQWNRIQPATPSDRRARGIYSQDRYSNAGRRNFRVMGGR